MSRDEQNFLPFFLQRLLGFFLSVMSVMTPPAATAGSVEEGRLVEDQVVRDALGIGSGLVYLGPGIGQEFFVFFPIDTPSS